MVFYKEPRRHIPAFHLSQPYWNCFMVHGSKSVEKQSVEKQVRNMQLTSILYADILYAYTGGPTYRNDAIHAQPY